jgi:hypothetical protein
MMHDIFYSVDNKKFYNTYIAHYESFKTGAKVFFNVETQAYDALNWPVEPTQTMDELMDQHAIRLRDNYDVLVFHWSGGTDSHTVYNVFKRNNIHIDEIRIITGNEHTPKFPQFFYNWIKQNHYDPTTEITTIDVLDTESKKSIIDRPDWIFDNIPFMPVFAYSSFEPSDLQRNNEKYSGRRWCMISGHEKPDLVYLKNSWYTRLEDRAMRQAMSPNLENFFLDPMIHLKQSHLLKNAVKKLWPGQFNNFDRAIHYFGPKTSRHTVDLSNTNYELFSMACGRHPELVPGHSNLQKRITRNQLSDLFFDENKKINFGGKFQDLVLREKMYDHDQMANKYVQGIQSFLSEKKFIDYLTQNHILGQSNNPLGIIPVFSKPYNIGN